MTAAALLFTHLALAADDAAWLAPGLAQLRAESAELTARVEQADALAAAAGRVQNRWADAVIAGQPVGCTDPNDAQLAERAARLGQAWRDAAQNARVQADRVRELIDAPTVTPLLTPEQQAPLLAQIEAAERHAGLWLEHLGWYRAFGGSNWAGCGVALVASPGLPGAPMAGHTAVIGLGGGYVCPGALPADGRPVVVSGTAACVAPTAECACAPAPVLPAAALRQSAD